MTTKYGQTPLDADEADGLKLPHIRTQSDLDTAEFRNIDLFLQNHAHTYSTNLDEQILRKIHIQMFGDVWKWAGEFRTTDKNI